MKKLLTPLCLFAFAASPGLASTITLASFKLENYLAETGVGVLVEEDFQSFTEGNIADGYATTVGTFASLGGEGSGGTIKNSQFDNDGSQLAMRDGQVYGRRSTTQYLTGDAKDDMFLDSNGTHGIAWTASAGGSLFNKIVLSVTDAADEGAIMEIVVGDSIYRLENQYQGRKWLVTIGLNERVSEASIFFRNWDSDGSMMANDGFSLDDVVLADVPLPASVALLLAGLGGLATFGRRKPA